MNGYFFYVLFVFLFRALAYTFMDLPIENEAFESLIVYGEWCSVVLVTLLWWMHSERTDEERRG